MARSRQPARPKVFEELRHIVGTDGLLQDAAALQPFNTDYRGVFPSEATAVVLPRSTAAVAEVVRVCGREGLAVVPQGGNTGLCGGATAPGGGVIINLSRMRRIRAIEPLENTLTVEAGCTLGAVKAAAAAHERLFPLSLAPEGSCQIGGNLSTNAGGHQVLRFGMSRDLVLGLEVVLASGEVLDLLSGLRKDNRGYDLKQLFLGAEGTLGIITAATLRLYPLPRQVVTALVQLADIPNAVPLLRLLQGQLGDRVTAFELIGLSGVELVQRSVPRSVNPLPGAQWMVLLEISDVQPGEGCRLQLEAGLAEGAAQGLLTDAVVAHSTGQAQALWQLREGISDAMRSAGASLKHDVSVPLKSIAGFVTRATEAVRAAMPGVQPVVFGHVGDGNLHFNLGQPAGWPAARFLAEGEALTDIVYRCTADYGGSFSAEHGIGVAKLSELERYRSAAALDVMRKLKQALDPGGILNPGKVLRERRW